MRYEHLLFLRYSLINLIGIAFLIVAYTQGFLNKAIKSDITNVVLLIIFLCMSSDCETYLSNLA